MNIPSVAEIAQLVSTGAITIEQLIKAVTSLYTLVQQIDNMAQDPLVVAVMGPVCSNLANAPVTEETLAGTSPQGKWIDPQETTLRVKAMAEAVAKEQWIDGFIMGMQVMSMLVSAGA